MITKEQAQNILAEEVKDPWNLTIKKAMETIISLSDEIEMLDKPLFLKCPKCGIVGSWQKNPSPIGSLVCPERPKHAAVLTNYALK